MTSIAAIQDQAGKLDYAPSFQMGHPLGFKAAEKLLELAPSNDFQYVFFTNSGSESVDTALKIALGYQQHKGKTDKMILVGRERAYHGVGFGGISVGGLPLNKQHFSLLKNVDHIVTTHNLEKNAFSKGMPEWGGDLAEDLHRIIEKHGSEQIAAFITEPMAGSTGVLIPPKGYLKKIREICTEHDILLIFDEVITGFRVNSGGAQSFFGITPHLATFAKAAAGGFPVSILTGSKEIMSLIGAGTVMHGGTLNANVMSMAATKSSMEHLSDKEIQTNKKLNDLGQRLIKGLQDINSRLEAGMLI
jgi:beta-alanine--pyruvate transaminase